MIYLDYNATTPLHEDVLQAMLPWLSKAHGNPSSVHQFGRRARHAIDQAREQVAALINAQPSQIVFTSGGTEANNFLIKGFAAQQDIPRRIAVSAIEHPCLLEAARSLQKSGWSVDLLPVNRRGLVEPASLQQQNDTALVSVMLANNETGVIQDVSTIKQYISDTPLHTDASQAVGKIPVDFAALGVQFMTLSGHKFYAPQGIGALVIDSHYELAPLLHGGGQERGRRSGTENLAAIVGFGAAADLAQQQLKERAAHCLHLRQQLDQALSSIPEVMILAADTERLPNTTMITVAGFSGETLLMLLDQNGIAVSSGSACHSEHAEPSHVLLAMGVSADEALNAIRISIGIHNTAADIHRFITVLKQQIETFSTLSLALAV